MMTADDVLKTKGYKNEELSKMTYKRKFEIAMSICGYEKDEVRDSSKKIVDKILGGK